MLPVRMNSDSLFARAITKLKAWYTSIVQVPVPSIDPRETNHIRVLHEQSVDRQERPQREVWSLVSVDGKRMVLLEVREAGNSRYGEVLIERRVMTLREALRGPNSVAERIWLGLDD